MRPALLVLALFPMLAAAQFEFFEHMFGGDGGHGGGHSPDAREWFERNYEDAECTDYLCPDTLACVKKPVDCPCLFPRSEEKCILPDKSNYVCISKDGRGCAFVDKAWKGEV
ncbi:uncharacterized protein V1510DRAFT_416183 [Dipodascopsis tothii]|uniref:uncharacterized protein n=1 Tax=Dipodascopsis tothii TaxID=44089 RepID=UPI0034CDD4ED